jgi:thymidylate synthase
MKKYLDLMEDVLENGVDRTGRNGSTRAVFARQVRFNLEDGFPAVTTKKLAWKSVVSELLWFLEGSGDDNRLKEILGKDKTIWTANAGADYWKLKAKFEGDLGRVYGVQWRAWQKPNGETVDQVAEVIERIKTNPYDRRLIVSAWNPGELDQMALPPCHMFFQFFVTPGKNGEPEKLSMHMVQRSCDLFLGVPFNIASYALLLSMIAQVTNLKPFELVMSFNDLHIYENHRDAVKEQLSRDPLPLPKLVLTPTITSIDDFTMEDIALEGYESHETIKAPMAV